MASQLRDRIKFEEWRGKTPLGYALFVKDFFVAGWQVPGWNPLRHRAPPSSKGPQQRVVYLSDKDVVSERGITITTFECDSITAAHDQLLQLLEHVQKPIGKDDWRHPVGDVGFSPTASSVLFARGNLVVIVQRAERQEVPVLDVAKALDGVLVSGTGSGSTVVPTIHDVVVTVDKTAVARIELKATDPLGRPTWARITAAGEIWGADDRVHVRPKGRGDQLDVRVFNENGGIAETRRTLP